MTWDKDKCWSLTSHMVKWPNQSQTSIDSCFAACRYLHSAVQKVTAVTGKTCKSNTYFWGNRKPPLLLPALPPPPSAYVQPAKFSRIIAAFLYRWYALSVTWQSQNTTIVYSTIWRLDYIKYNSGSEDRDELIEQPDWLASSSCRSKSASSSSPTGSSIITRAS